MIKVEVMCCKCGKSETVDATRHPESAHELFTICALAQFVAGIDMKRDRALVFCSKECRAASKTEIGDFELSLPYMEVA
jgi:hypothetical protein